MRQRLAAIVALVAGAATVALAIAVAVSEFPRGLVLLGCVVVAGVSAWYGVLRRGVARVAGLTVAALALAGAVVLLVVEGSPLADLLVVAGLLVSLAASRAALAGMWICPAPRHHASRCCSTTRVRVAARRSVSRSPTRPVRVGSSRSS